MHMLRRQQQRREPPPPSWTIFCHDWLQLNHELTWAWWKALQKAQWHRAITLRSAVLGLRVASGTPGAFKNLFEKNITPQSCVEVLIDLIREGHLSRDVVRPIETAVLARTNKMGSWQ